MSGAPRPGAVRLETFENPVLSEENRNQPVTPTISHDNDVFVPPAADLQGFPRDLPQHVLEAVGATIDPNNSPATAADGARSGEDLLRRLSLSAPPKPNFEDADPRTAHPGLTLSGNVISAAFCVPYKIGYTSNGEWVGLTCVGRSSTVLTPH